MINDWLPKKEELTIWDILPEIILDPKNKEFIVDRLDNNEAWYHALVVHYRKDLDYELPESVLDDLLSWLHLDQEVIKDVGEYIQESARNYGSDIAANPPDGSWTADLYEFFGFYMWIEPEGETVGFFSSKEAAIRLGHHYWG